MKRMARTRRSERRRLTGGALIAALGLLYACAGARVSGPPPGDTGAATNPAESPPASSAPQSSGREGPSPFSNADDPERWHPMPFDLAIEEPLPGLAPGLPTLLREHESTPLPEPPPPPAIPATPSPPHGTPLTTAERLAEAWRRYYDDDVNAALAAFLDLSRDAPHRGDAWLGLGLAHLSRGELGDAEDAFEGGLSVSPRDPALLFYRGVVPYQREAYAEALAWWTKVAPLIDERLPGPLPRDHAWLSARAHLALGHTDEGYRLFRRALQRGGEDEHHHLHPPPVLLERLADGRLPAGRVHPVGGWTHDKLERDLLFSQGRAIWRLEAEAPIRVRISDPPYLHVDRFPVPSPTRGDTLAFLSLGPKGHNRLILQEGTKRRILAQGRLLPTAPAFSPDGNLIAYVDVVGNPAKAGIRIVHVATGDIESLAWPAEDVEAIAFTPDGRLIAARRGRGPLPLSLHALGGEDEGRDLIPYPSRKEAEDRALDARRRPGERDADDPGGHPSPPAVRKRLAALRRARQPKRPPMIVKEPWLDAVDAIVGQPGQDTAIDEGERNARGSKSSGPSHPRTPTNDAADTASSTARPPLERLKDKLSKRYGVLSDPAPHPRLGIKRLLFSKARGGRRRIWLRDEDEHLERPLTPEGIDCRSARWSPSGKTILVVCTESGEADGSRIHVIGPDDRPAGGWSERAWRRGVVMEEPGDVREAVWSGE